MKKKFLLYSALLCAFTYTLSSYRPGPDAFAGYDCTGAESASSAPIMGVTGCNAGSTCHSSAATPTISCVLKLDSAGVATTRYIAGMTYTVTITGTNSSGNGNRNYGFQLAAIQGTASAATVTNAGTLQSTGLPANIHNQTPSSSVNINIIEHGDTLAVPTGTTAYTQSFTWTAPATGVGSISFWGATNFVNGNGVADAGDIWNTGNLVVTEEAPLGVATVVNTAEYNVYPNPMTNVLNVAFQAPGGITDVAIYDLSGNLVATKTIGAGSNLATFETTGWANGMYYVAIMGNGKLINTIAVVKR